MYPLLHVTADLSWTAFSVHWSTVIGLTMLGMLYAWRVRVEFASASPPPPLGRTRPALFGTGLVLMFFALNGWLHDLSDFYLFSAHMIQHLALALVIAPLLVVGTPDWMLRPALHNRTVSTMAHAITRPIAAFGLFNVVLAAWHLPPMYNLAMAHHDIHIVQHLMFLVVSVIMWWPVLSPMPEFRIPYPAQMLYMFLMTLPMSIVAVYITYASSILYPAYASAPRFWGISPMMDQMIGGLIMWIPGGFYFFGVISVLFFRWQKDEPVTEWATT